MAILVQFFGEILQRNIATFTLPFKFAHSHRKLLPALCLALTISSQSVNAGFERTAQPALLNGTALANLFGGGADAALLNPSAIADLHVIYLSSFYSPSPFELPQLSNGGMLAAFPVESADGAIGITTAGFSLYREVTATAIVAKSFNNIFSAGLGLNFNHLAIARYGSAFVVGLDLGATVQVADDLSWGFALLNVNRPSIGKSDDELPLISITGFSYALLPDALVSFALIKDVRFPVSVRTGILFSPLEIIQVRFGVASEPARYSAGLGVKAAQITFDYSVSTHLELGLTHTLGLSITL